MTLAYLLAPIPKWVLLNNEGTAAGGAKLYTYRSLNKIQPKTVFQDAGGTVPWTNPIIFDLNGVQGPFYWQVDSDDLEDTYYLEAYDADNNLLWTIDDYFPPGEGGGGNVTTYVPLTNYITNSVFIDKIDNTANPIGETFLVVAPSNHKGFTPSAINPVVTAYGVVSPDIVFTKNNLNATDQITFPLFPLASFPLTGDVTPVYYCRYQCTNSPAGETYKNFQFPICQKVKNLSNQSMTFRLWAAVTATPVVLTIFALQYYGSGTAATAPVQTIIGTITLTTTWTPYDINFTMPDVSAGSLGTVGQQTDDDAVYIQIGMPLGSPCDVLFTNPCLFLGNINPSLDFESYDQINSINSTPRTGDVKTTLSSLPPSGGWVAMNDGSIGNVGSVATNRANADTFQLYKTIWDGVINTWAPVSGGRGSSAIADFIANKTLTLPRSLGRAMAGAGHGAGLSSRALGQFTGAETDTLTKAQIPNPLTTNAVTANVAAGSDVTVIASSSGSGGGVVSNFGGANPITIVGPTSFMNIFIKL